MNTLYESMTRVFVYPSLDHDEDATTVRVWRATRKPEMGPDSEIQAVIDRAVHVHRSSADSSPHDLRMSLIEALAAMPRVEAVEVLDAQGNGALIYPDWK